jgi:predicted aspartyl protease
MCLAGVVSGTGVHILVDMGATHNIIDINVACLIGLLEQHIDTTILIGSGKEVSCRAAAFNMPLRIDTDIFYIDAFVLDIGNNVDIILGTPWLAGLRRLTWDFSTMELQYYRNGQPITFTTI